MDERSSRVFFGLCLLVLVWIGVYWMWQPSRDQDPTFTFEQTPLDDPDTGLVISRDDPIDSVAESVIDTEPVSVVDPAPEVVVEEPPSQAVRLIPPEFLEHIVQPGELMQSIARHYYGSINEWSVIARANPRVDPQKIKPGMVLRIPVDKENIQGLLEGEEVRPGVISSHVDSAGSKVIEYVVRSGDSLSLISQRIYGSSRHAKFIYESNRDVLRSMDAISVGQLLRLPPLPEESGADG